MTTIKTSGFNDPFDNLLPSPDTAIQRKRVNSRPGKITKITNLTHDTIEVTVTCDKNTPPFNAKAGQYGTLKVDGIDRPRAYSFAKAPILEKKNQVTFFIRLIEGGELSDWFKQKQRTKENVTVSGPMGKFGLDNTNDTIVCIAGGSGMSAIKALVEQASHQSLARDCLFFYGARTQADLYCLEEMEAIKQQWHPDHSFTFIPVLSEESHDCDWQGPRGFVTEYLKSHYIDTRQLDINHIKAFFCGPPAMIDHGVTVLQDAGLPSEAIRYDKFEDIRSPAPVIDNRKCTLCDECLLVKPLANCIVETSAFSHSRQTGLTDIETIRPGRTSGLYYSTLLINNDQCIRCYACVDACPHNAISPANLAIPQVLKLIQL